PGGIVISGSNNVTVNDVTVNDVSQFAVGTNAASGTRVNRVTNNQHAVLQHYIQWQFDFSGGNDEICTDCVVNATSLTQGFECFAETNCSYVRPASINAAFSMNNADNWSIQNGSITIQAASSLPPAWSANNPIIIVNTNAGSDNVASGGTISNTAINVQGYI